TLGTWLQADGYRTALVGKYLNGYYPGTVSYVPPGWDQWDALALQNTPDGDQQGGYYNYAMSVNGTYTFHGSDPSDYSTDVLSGMATDFISSTPSGQPLFLYFAPRAPHEPATPAPRDKTTCTSVPPNRPPNYNEADVSDKPPYVQKLPVWDPATIARWDAFHVKQCRSLQAVDDAVGSIVDALSASGRLSNTLLLFMSDNGLADGEHRWEKKTVPYDESIRIPMVLRYDPVTAGHSTADGHLVSN